MADPSFKDRTFSYERERPNDIPEDFQNREETFVLEDVFHSKGGPFQRLLDCGGIRYVLLLEFNNDIDSCMENDLLEMMYDGFDLADEDINRCRRSLTLFSKEAMKAFWPYLKEDFDTRIRNSTLMERIGPLDYDRKDSHKLQLKTIDGTVCAIEHNIPLDDRSEPFGNTYPDLICFPKTEVEILETITRSEFKVRIQDEEYTLRAGCHGLKCLIEKLNGAPMHPNVVHLSGAVVDEEGKIMGILMPVISKKNLWSISSATKSQKEKWKTKITDAVNFLHNEGIVWGSAWPDNIDINNATDEPVLFDFTPAAPEEWVDRDLLGTKDGDLQALPRILKCVDNIPSSEE